MSPTLIEGSSVNCSQSNSKRDFVIQEPDAEWQRIGLSAPARKALVDAKLYKVSDLRKVTLEELTELHGMGKSSIARIKVIMEAKKIRFR